MMVLENSFEVIWDVVCELLDVIEVNNVCFFEDIVSVIFFVIFDFDVIFLVAIVR